MTTPANAIKHEVRTLIDFQIATFAQLTAITSSQLHEYHSRSEKLRTLCQELDRIGTRSVVDGRREMASYGGSTLF
jgi:hypothetical protein